MTVFSVGKISVSRVEETYLPTYPARQIFPEWSDEINARHGHWLAPNHYEEATGLIQPGSWLIGKNVPENSISGMAPNLIG